MDQERVNELQERRRRLSAEVLGKIAELASARGGDDPDAVSDAAHSALHELNSWFREELDLTRQIVAAAEEAMPIADIVRENVAARRQIHEVTQAELAAAMRELGFVTWQRITVAEVESGKRRLRLEEIFGLAVLFGTGISGLLMSSVDVVLNERKALAQWDYRNLLVGHSVGETAARAAGVELGSPEDWRPAAKRRHLDELNEVLRDTGGEAVL